MSLDPLSEGLKVGRFCSSRIALQLCQGQGVLEGSDLSLELVVELSQCLLFTDDIFPIENRLLLITIWLGLLLFHLLFDVSKHLKEMIFGLLWWLDTGVYPLRRRGASVLGSTRLIVGRRGDIAPNGADGLTFWHSAIKDDNLLS